MKSLVLSAVYSEAAIHHAPHYHDCHQVLYIVDGQVDVTVGNRQYVANGGSLVLISRFEQHAISAKNTVYKRFALRISPQVSATRPEDYLLFSALFNRNTGFRHVIPVGDDREACRALFETLANEKASDKPLAAEACNLLLLQILLLLYRRAPEFFTASDRENTEIVRRIQSRFESDFRQEFSLQSLASEYHLSTFYLCHIFKSITGYPLMGHLQSCRIAAAKKYLTKTSWRIGEIVEACGFRDNSNFSRTFKAETGLSPTEFRRKYATQVKNQK